jgi:urease accessory protein
MLNLTEKLDTNVAFDATMTLPFDVRQKSRFRATLDDGQEVGVILPRGAVLREGDCLRAEQGDVVMVRAAQETVSTVHVTDALLLARAAYHLGNRHVPLQITAQWLRYQHDHVLDDLIRQMGLDVVCEQAPFEPEAGAYSGGGHAHHHSHAHD